MKAIIIRSQLLKTNWAQLPEPQFFLNLAPVRLTETASPYHTTRPTDPQLPCPNTRFGSGGCGTTSVFPPPAARPPAGGRSRRRHWDMSAWKQQLGVVSTQKPLKKRPLQRRCVTCCSTTPSRHTKFFLPEDSNTQNLFRPQWATNDGTRCPCCAAGRPARAAPAAAPTRGPRGRQPPAPARPRLGKCLARPRSPHK